MDGFSSGGVTLKLSGAALRRRLQCERVFVRPVAPQHHEHAFAVKPDRTGVCTNMRAVLPSSPNLFAQSGRFAMADITLTARQRQILEFIEASHARAGLPAVGPRDRRGGGADARRPPCTPTSPRCSGSATSAATPPSPGPSRCATTRLGRRRSSAARCATCPLVGDVAAGTDVLAQENVEEVVPVPADLTGDGELFMLRVRGDSMIDAGILDGDFVVARVQPTAEQGRHRRGRHPRRGGHGQDLSTARAARSC